MHTSNLIGRSNIPAQLDRNLYRRTPDPSGDVIHPHLRCGSGNETISNSIKLRDVMQGTTYISHSTFGWSVGETVRCSISKIDRCSIPNIDRCLIPKIDQCAVAEVNDRLIAEWDRSQNRTAAPLLEHGIGPSLYCSIKKPLVVQCLVARPPGPP